MTAGSIWALDIFGKRSCVHKKHWYTHVTIAGSPFVHLAELLSKTDHAILEVYLSIQIVRITLFLLSVTRLER